MIKYLKIGISVICLICFMCGIGASLIIMLDNIHEGNYFNVFEAFVAACICAAFAAAFMPKDL